MVLPIEGRWRLAKGEAVEVAGHGTLECIELPGRARIETAVEAVFLGVHHKCGVTRPVGAACVARKRHRALRLAELDH